MTMNRRLDMSRHGFPIDFLRRLKYHGLGHTEVRTQGAGRVAKLQSDGLVRRQVRTTGRVEAGSVFREVFAGVEQFPALSVYVHGSWGDGTMTPFSDYDDLVIVDYARVEGERELRRMEAFLHEVDGRFCRRDPLQHHGHWIVAREELAALDESYIPLSVLEGAVCVQGEEEIEYRVDVERSKKGFRRNIGLTCEGVERFYRDYGEGRINLFDMKCLAGSFFIMPAYVFQSRGELISKPEAIRRAGDLFGAGACAVIATCTEIRREWGRVVDTPEFGRFRRMGRFFKNGNMHRRYARAMAGRFPVEEFPVLAADEVAEFVKEARDHANRE